MPLGIKPTVDFAFKKIFGSPENSQSLIGLLNAILQPPHPIEAVELLNPFSYQEFAEGKLIVLDVKCRDTSGKWLNVEMQVSVYSGLLERLVYYACSLFTDQLRSGQQYSQVAPAIAICLLSKVVFPATEQRHHRFQLVDVLSGRELENGVEVHTVELTKYNLTEGSISGADKLRQWAFFLLRAQEYGAEQLRELLPGLEFVPAIQTISTISAQTDDRAMYDQREKAQRDYDWAMSGARQEGREVGREEGKLVARIQACEEQLGGPVTDDAKLDGLGLEELKSLLASLKQRLREDRR